MMNVPPIYTILSTVILTGTTIILVHRFSALNYDLIVDSLKYGVWLLNNEQISDNARAYKEIMSIYL